MNKYKNNLTDEIIDQYEYDRLDPLEQSNHTKIDESEFGNLSIMTDGHLGMNLGNGLSLDLSDGKLGINLGGGFSLPL